MHGSATPSTEVLVVGGPLAGYTFDLYRRLEALGGVRVRFLHQELGGASFAHEDPSRQYGRRLLWDRAGAAEAFGFLRAPWPDVAIVYGTQPRLRMMAAMLALPRRTRAYFASDNNIAGEPPSPLMRGLRRAAYAPFAARCRTALSLGESNRLALAELGFARTLFLPVCTVDFDEFGPIPAKRPPRNEHRIVCIARLVPAKGLVELLEFSAAHPSLLSGATLTIVGEGPLRDKLESIASSSRLPVELLGAASRAQVGELLRTCDVVIQPSLDEPWGIAVTEALGMGVPVVATPSVGAATSLAARTEAVVVSAGLDPGSFAAALGEARRNLSRLRAHAAASAEAVRRDYGRTSVAQRLHALVSGPGQEREGLRG